MLGICAVPVIEIEGVIMDLEDVDLLVSMDRKNTQCLRISKL